MHASTGGLSHDEDAGGLTRLQYRSRAQREVRRAHAAAAHGNQKIFERRVTIRDCVAHQPVRS
jgi:hypothetical protein